MVFSKWHISMNRCLYSWMMQGGLFDSPLSTNRSLMIIIQISHNDTYELCEQLYQWTMGLTTGLEIVRIQYSRYRDQGSIITYWWLMLFSQEYELDKIKKHITRLKTLCRGYDESGASGFLRGAYIGVIGFFLSPLVNLLETSADFAERIRDRMIGPPEVVPRLRPPRYVSSVDALAAYDRNEVRLSLYLTSCYSVILFRNTFSSYFFMLLDQQYEGNSLLCKSSLSCHYLLAKWCW